MRYDIRLHNMPGLNAEEFYFGALRASDTANIIPGKDLLKLTVLPQ
ncbi:hypothetical protein [Erwinia sp. JUb26]|nr:hypothetical protein [Erwinia sp. JUb26]